MEEHTSESYEYEMGERPTEEKNKTVIIIVIVAVVLLLCCCCLAFGGTLLYFLSSGEFGLSPISLLLAA